MKKGDRILVVYNDMMEVGAGIEMNRVAKATFVRYVKAGVELFEDDIDALMFIPSHRIRCVCWLEDTE